MQQLQQPKVLKLLQLRKAAESSAARSQNSRCVFGGDWGRLLHLSESISSWISLSICLTASPTALKLCQHQSWVTSGPRLLQHLLCLLTALDEPSAANATLFGLVFPLLFFVEWRQEIHQQSYTSLDKSTDGLGTLISWCKHWLRRTRIIISQSYRASSAIPVVRAKHSCQDKLNSNAHRTPPEVSCISAIQRDKTPQPRFHCNTLVFTPWNKDQSTTGSLPRLLLRLCPSQKARIYFA